MNDEEEFFVVWDPALVAFPLHETEDAATAAARVSHAASGRRLYIMRAVSVLRRERVRLPSVNPDGPPDRAACGRALPGDDPCSLEEGHASPCGRVCPACAGRPLIGRCGLEFATPAGVRHACSLEPHAGRTLSHRCDRAEPDFFSGLARAGECETCRAAMEAPGRRCSAGEGGHACALEPGHQMRHVPACLLAEARALTAAVVEDAARSVPRGAVIPACSRCQDRINVAEDMGNAMCGYAIGGRRRHWCGMESGHESRRAGLGLDTEQAHVPACRILRRPVSCEACETWNTTARTTARTERDPACGARVVNNRNVAHRCRLARVHDGPHAPRCAEEEHDGDAVPIPAADDDDDVPF